MQLGYKTIAALYRSSLIRLRSLHACNENIRPQTSHLIAHLMFEPDDHSHRNNHYGQANSNAHHGNTHSGLRNFFAALIAFIDAARYKKFPVHIIRLHVRDKLRVLYEAQTAHATGLLSSIRRLHVLHYDPVPE